LPEDKSNFVTLLQELRAAYNPEGLILTASVAAMEATVQAVSV